ncbi:hypothetical protein K439DRAFT_1421217, partial [Ramaria rubella]
MASLPPLSDVLSSPGTQDSPLASALSTLFEPSPILLNTLVPQLSAQTLSFDTYFSLIDVAMSAISSWEPHAKALFISGHPRIGEVTNLSHLSRQEQAAKATPPDVLERLAELNALYEQQYPGLRYITFVNGRSRAAIRDEMEAKLGTQHRDDVAGQDVVSFQVEGLEWLKELERAIGDIGKIAKSRLGALDVL